MKNEKAVYEALHVLRGYGKHSVIALVIRAIRVIRGSSLFLGLFAVTSLCRAQIQQAWVARYNNGITNGTNQSLKMALDPSGNIYVTGYSQNTNGNLDYATIKYAPNGNPLWVDRYDSTNSPSATPAALVLDGQTNVIVTGTALTVKYDANGNQLWTAPYAGNSAAVDTNSNVYVTGYDTNFSLVKLNASGSNVWVQAYITGYGADVAQSLAVDSGGNIFQTGSVAYNGIYEDGFDYYSDALEIIKYAADGVEQWRAQDTGEEDNLSLYVVGTILDKQGNLYAESTVNESFPYETTKFSGTNGDLVWAATASYGNVWSEASFAAATGLCADSFGNVVVTSAYYIWSIYTSQPSRYGTYKLNTNGTYIGANLYPTVASANSVGNAIAVDQSNFVYVTGYSPGTNSANDVVTIKYDNNLNQIWVQRYSSPGNGNAAGNAIAVDTNGNVYVTGYDTTTAGGTEMVTIKYAPGPQVQMLPNGDFLLQAEGSAFEPFDFQATTNFQTWQDLGTNNADSNGVVQFLDTNAPAHQNRFYLPIPQ
jgi:hypothetical protein